MSGRAGTRRLRRALVALGGLVAAGLAVPVAQTAAPAPASAAGTSVHLTAAGDYGTSSDTTGVLDGVRAAAPDLHLGLGDYSYGGPGSEPSWCSYVKSHVGSTLPFELVSGNHESNGLDGQIENFASCLPNRLPGLVGTYGREWYVDVPAADPVMRIVMISPNLKFPGENTWSYAAGTAHYSWTAAAIDGAHAAGIPWVVVGFHEPCLSMTSGPCNTGPDLLNMLVAKKVDLVLMGHVHLYERTKQLGLSGSCPAITPGTSSAACIADGDSTMTQGGTVFATVGTGGEVQQHPTLTDPEAAYFAAYNGVKSSSWGFLDVRADSGRLDAAFRTTSGTTLADSFSITRGASPPPPPPPPPPDGDLAFVGATQATGGSALSESVTVPATAQPGDTMLLVSSGSAGWSQPSGLTGWTSLGTTTSGSVTSRAWVRPVAAGDAGRTVRITSATYTKAVLSLAVYAGVDTAAVAAAHAQDTNRSSHTGPAVTVPAGAWAVSYWADKSGATTSWTAPGGVTVRGVAAGTGSGRYSARLADTGGPRNAGGYGPLTAVANATSSAAVAWTFTLPPAGGGSGGGGGGGGTPSDIAFDGTAHATGGSVRTLSTAVPATAHAGDALVLLFSGTTGWTGPVGVSGWRSVDSFTVGGITSSLWVKTATAADVGANVQMQSSTYTKGVLQVTAYAGVDTAAITAARAGQTNTSTHTAPAVTVPGGAWAMEWWSEKSSATTAWTAPAGVTQRDVAFGTGSGRYSALLADSGGPLPAGSHGPFTATADSAGTAAAAWSVVLPPVTSP
jgi:hypothetical protein